MVILPLLGVPFQEGASSGRWVRRAVATPLHVVLDRASATRHVSISKENISLSMCLNSSDIAENFTNYCPKCARPENEVQTKKFLQFYHLGHYYIMPDFAVVTVCCLGDCIFCTLALSQLTNSISL